MHYTDALSVIRRSTSPELPDPQLTFVSPVVAAILSAAAIRDERFRSIQFASSDSRAYGQITGLSEALEGRAPVGRPGDLHGKTYSRLTKLAHDYEVDNCNKVIADLVYDQLSGDGNEAFVYGLVKVIGELHDNVASHANGAGFSCAQLYRTNYRKRLEFAVADAGCGMLRNAQRVDGSVTSHADAITWCLKRGNTSAKSRQAWAQRLPEDCMLSPLPASVSTFHSDNHHIGEGLWKLTELVGAASGRAWIWTGNHAILINGKSRTGQGTDIEWRGVAFELEFDVGKVQALQEAGQSDQRSHLAQRLGL